MLSKTFITQVQGTDSVPWRWHSWPGWMSGSLCSNRNQHQPNGACSIEHYIVLRHVAKQQCVTCRCHSDISSGTMAWGDMGCVRWSGHECSWTGGLSIKLLCASWFKDVILNIHVDDLTLSGAATLHQAFWQEMRKHINIEPEVYRGKVRNHCANNEVQTSRMYFDMRPYAAQTV